MLRQMQHITGYKLQAEDGLIGHCKDFLFDDEQWAVRYMVADTGGWLTGRKVLISPIALGKPSWESQTFPVNLTKKQIEESPPLEENAPVSRQYEQQWHWFYGWPAYWGGPGVWGAGAVPGELYGKGPKEQQNTDGEDNPEEEENHLRSMKEVQGYRIQATDKNIGHVEDFIVEEGTWVIRYVVIDTRTLLPGKKVLISPNWMKAIHWTEGEVEVGLTSEVIEKSPEYHASMSLDRNYEQQLYNYYQFPTYWP